DHHPPPWRDPGLRHSGWPPAPDGLPRCARRRARAADLSRHHREAGPVFPGLRTMTARFRLIRPPGWVFFCFMVVYIVLRLPAWIGLGFWGIAPAVGKRPTDGLLVIAAIAYGVYRVVAFHPFYRADYRAWLEWTPWSSRKPLPIGPVGWVW